MRINKLQLKRAVSAVLFVLLLSAVGMTNSNAQPGALNGVFSVSDDHEYVDLGLPSGLLWATCNVGANAPEEYGDYFAWGETAPKDVYNWDTYQYCMGSDYTLTKYCNNPDYGYNGFTDTITILLPEDDAATANWGNEWRMPTAEEWQELYNNTTVTWTQQNGVNGRLFTASNGNSLFLPAAGWRWDSNLYGVGSDGLYWSSSLITGTPNRAWFFGFDSDYYYDEGSSYRYSGFSVRAVRSASPSAQLPQVTTSEVTDFTTSTATCGGEVVSDGGAAVAERGVCWSTSPNPTVGGNHLSSGAGVGAFSVDITGLEAATTYYVRAYATNAVGTAYGNEVSFTTLFGGDHAYIDLGLPSGTLWATCNVGANVPEEYGDYFAWGETQPKDVYNWDTYQYCMGSYNTLTKYCNDPNYGYEGFTDNLAILLPEDDAATANWGDGWRMPTRQEWQELLNNTTVTWTQQNGVNGRLFTASNGNSLFLPAAGSHWDSDLYYVGSNGYYWSSSLYTDDPNGADDPWDFYFFNSYYYMDYGNRCAGLSVRAVRSASLSAQLPQVTTSEVTDFTTLTATCGGEVVSDGGAVVTERGVCWATNPNPTVGVNHLSSGAGVGAFSVDITGLEPATTYYVRAYATNAVGTAYGNEVNFTTLPGGDHEYVDLGLPSGLLWATCNVGANAPEEYGDYFAWGETAPKDYYDWDTYQYYDGWNVTKYTGSDGLTILLPEDDAATANWGNGWRMPTKEEWQELYNNTTVTWTQQNGINGRLFTASNGNSLFLPAAGFRFDSGFDYFGSGCCCWSSSLITGTPNRAWFFYFHSVNYGMDDGFYRWYGFSVRAVRTGSPSAQLPQVTTSEVADFTTSTATCGGEVVSDGGAVVTERGVCWSTSPNPTVGGNHLSSGAGVGAFSVDITGLEAATTYYVRAYATNAVGTAYGNEVSFTTLFGGNHAYIDLGLPSGLLWATCNVGANAPEEYGDYFAWGETAPKDVYNWDTYQYCMGSYNTLTKYCSRSDYGYNGFTDNLTILLPEDDAATANWGNGWRMPTKEEWQELYNNTTVTWTQQNGINGRLFTASNGNSLFLPAAGYRWDSYLYNVGWNGLYWSSSLNTGDPSSAWYFSFNSDYYRMSNYYRYFGHSVRAVRTAVYTITATASPEEGGTIEGAGSYAEGSTCTLTATANDGYTFINWTKDGTVVSTNPIYSFTVTGSGTYVANFTSDSGGYHWTVNVNQYPNTMTAIGVILINDVEQMTHVLELGAFCGTECRGRERLAYISQMDRYLLFLTMYGENGDELNFRLYDHALGQELDVICTNSVPFATNNTLGTVVSPYEFSFMEGIQTQTSSLPEGWSWWSTYIEQEGIDGLTQLENSLGENGVMIKSQSEGFTSRYGEYWFGLLNSINNESSYLVQTSGSCDVSLTGHVAIPSEHPITLLPGWTWIGYPNNTAMSVSTALSNLNPSENDMLKAQESFSVYYPSIGWFGSLQTIMPGMGLMYESHNTSSVTLTYSNPTRTDDLAENVTARTNHWNPDVYAYPNNMNVMAVVEVNGEELQSEDYELAAFANGECRGSAKLMYVEQLRRYMAFLTLHGDEEAELSFGLYDNATGMTAYKSDARLIFTANTVAGSPDNPMVVSFSDITGIDSFGGTLQVFPNPVERGSMITIGKVEESDEVRVEIMNALGAVLSTETSTRLPANIKAPEVPGVYMLRISSKGRGIRYVKLIVS